MTRIHKSIDSLVGHTPLLRLGRIEKSKNLDAALLAKLEYFNPAGSVKDRVALFMLNRAEQDGSLKPGGTVIEPTSGNTGIALAALCAARGYRLIITMPESMSIERRRLMQAYGAELVLTPAAAGMKGAIERANQLHSEIPGAIIAGQFVNPANPLAHFQTTGPEIWEDTQGQTDIFVAGAGTGGTLAGVGRYLKSRNPATRIVAVEPANSSVLRGGKPGLHKIQGIGAGFVPEILDRQVIDEVIAIPDEDALAAARLAAKEGVLCGISSGAALHAACQLAQRPENQGKTIVALFPDSGDRYLSSGLYDTVENA